MSLTAPGVLIRCLAAKIVRAGAKLGAFKRFKAPTEAQQKAATGGQSPGGLRLLESLSERRSDMVNNWLTPTEAALLMRERVER